MARTPNFGPHPFAGGPTHTIGEPALRGRSPALRAFFLLRCAIVRSRPLLVSGALISALAVTACAPPGGSSAPSQSARPDFADGAPSCGEDDTVLDMYAETGFPLPIELTDEFTRQYPHVTFDIREDQFAVLTQNAPRVLQDSPPDLMRLPQMSELASGGLLMDLDPYAEAFGWDQWPESQLEQLRVDDEGRRGDGPLYGMGLNFSMTGVFYNKTLAEQIGMTEAPRTLEEFDGYLQAAKDAGITPIAQFNGGATGGLLFPLQGLMASYGKTGPINDWGTTTVHNHHFAVELIRNKVGGWSRVEKSRNKSRPALNVNSTPTNSIDRA